jgi:tetratricopeptide (TPR) repeat protein
VSSPSPELVQALRERYQIERELGRGGSATVWLARDLRHGREVAIKVLDPEVASALGPERFLREIETAAGLTHPHILPLVDSGRAGDTIWHITPYIEGESLRARIEREGPLPLDEVARVTREVADALGYAHARGVVHRDVKPENVLLASGHALLADFGIAHVAGDTVATRLALTPAGLAVGTPSYMAPEQAQAGRVDARSDIYALGCMVYEMLVGEPPFTGPDVATVQRRHLFETPPPLAARRPGVPAMMEAVILRALAKAPADRYPSAQALADALAGALPGTSPLVPTAPPPAPVPQRERSRVLGALTAGVVVLLALVAWRAGTFEDLLDRLRGGSGSAHDQRWVLLASFDGPADDPEVAQAARDLVRAALDQSRTLAAVSADQTRMALALASRPDTARVDVPLARELAVRSAIPVVVHGAVRRPGTSYALVLTALDAEDGRTLLTVHESASGSADLVPMFERAGRRLRSGLGERLDRLRPARVPHIAMTPSFEAYKAWSAGAELVTGGRPDRAVPLLKRAIALDPQFAMAWASLGTAWNNLVMFDSARVADAQALRWPQRLTPSRRANLEAKLALQSGDIAGALAAYDVALAGDTGPTDRSALLNNKALALGLAGRFEEALAVQREACASFPVGVPVITRGNLAYTLVRLGHIDAALLEAQALGPSQDVELRLLLSLHTRGTGATDSLASVYATDPTLSGRSRRLAALWGAAFAARRGEVARTRGLLADLRHEAVAESDELVTFRSWVHENWMSMLEGGGVPPLPPSVAGFGRVSQVLLGRLVPDSLLRTRPTRFPAHVEVAVREWRRGVTAHREQRWVEAATALGTASRGEVATEIEPIEAFHARARWLRGDAFEHTGELDSAIVEFARLADPPERTAPVLLASLTAEPYARRRLVHLLLARGRIEDARRQWQELLRACTHPDPEVAARLEETRMALQLAASRDPVSRR